MAARKDYISWDEYFMGVALLSALRSKDPSTRNGSVIVNPINKHIISTGYNGHLNIKNNDKIFTWNKRGFPNKYNFVVHSEANAILNNSTDLTGCVLYLYSEKKYPPCQECTKLIIQKGIKEIVMIGMIKQNTSEYNWYPSRYMLKKAGIKIRILKKFNKNINNLIQTKE